MLTFPVMADRGVALCVYIVRVSGADRMYLLSRRLLEAVQSDTLLFGCEFGCEFGCLAQEGYLGPLGLVVQTLALAVADLEAAGRAD